MYLENMEAHRPLVDLVLEHVLPQIQLHQATEDAAPFVLGITGLQGSGKSTLATAVKDALQQKHHLTVVSVSLDDLYHTHERLQEIKTQNRQNPLLQTRGQPGTHDEVLAAQFFESLRSGGTVLVPSFDKSKFGGQGDRAPREEWLCVPSSPPIDVVIFEGWCVGFQSLPADKLQARWELAKTEEAPPQTFNTHTLAGLELEHVRRINSNLRIYNETFMGPGSFHYLVHLDTDALENVYHWRLDQEHALWRAKGQGMSDDAVVKFVKGYMPSYELYLDRLREEQFPASGEQGSHLRVVLDRDRQVDGINVLKKHDKAT